jgi:hypothetical protein
MHDTLFKRLALTKYLAIALLFFMPFFGVSCMGIQAMKLSGTDLAFGTTKEIRDPTSSKAKPKKEVIKANWRATAAFAVALAGFVASLALRERLLRLTVLGLGAAGALSLLLLKMQLEDWVSERGRGVVVVSTEFSFWACLLLFVGGALAAALAPPGLGLRRANAQPTAAGGAS